MASRKIQSDGCSILAPGVIRYGQLPGSISAAHGPREPFRQPELVEKKIASQAAEIERLSGDNHKLAATHVALRKDLITARDEAQKLKEHIRSIQSESDIQIRVLQEKIAKMEAVIRVGDSVKKELQQAHVELQNLVKARQGLITQIQQASQELLKTQADVKSLPELHAELEGLRKEHQKLRVTFQYEKGSNIDQVQQMQAMEKNLIGMAREVEKLRSEVLNAENRVHAPIGAVPYAGGYMNPAPSFIPSFLGGSTYLDGYGQPVMQMGLGPTEGMIYGNSANLPTVTAAAGTQAVPGSGW